MFVDYLTILMANVAAGLFILGLYVLLDLDKPDEKRMVPGFLAVGLIGTIGGLHMTLTWPLPGSFNIAFGEMTLLFGVMFLVAAVAIARQWPLASIGVYAMFAGLIAAVIGVRVMGLGLTSSPTISGISFLVAGVGGILVGPGTFIKNRSLRVVVAALLFIGSLLWLYAALGSYWGHLERFADFVPLTLR